MFEPLKRYPTGSLGINNLINVYDAINLIHVYDVNVDDIINRRLVSGYDAHRQSQVLVVNADVMVASHHNGSFSIKYWYNNHVVCEDIQSDEICSKLSSLSSLIWGLVRMTHLTSQAIGFSV